VRSHLFDPEQFRDQVVVVTGAGRGSGAGGIGYNVAMAFAHAGAKLAIIGRTEEKLRLTAADIKAIGGETLYVVGDVSDAAAVERLFAETERVYGRVDVLVNNAGLSGEVRALERIPARNFRYAFNVHVHTMATTRLAAKMMREKGVQGTILNVGTYFTSPNRQSVRPYPFRTPYTAAQAWKLEHSRASAWNLAGDGIRVVAINPGPVEGGRIDAIVYPLGALERGLWGRDVAGADIRRKTEEMHPGGRFLKQEDVARSILALVSRELRDSANGSVVELTGGLDYKVPPQVAPPLLGGGTPDLSGKRILLVGRPTPAQASALTLAFSSCGAKVVIASPDAAETLSDLAGGHSPSEYSDGQKRLLGKVTAVSLDPGHEEEVADFFDKLTGGENGTQPGPDTEIDSIIVLSGDASVTGDLDGLTPEDERIWKERFAFEPSSLLRYAAAALLLQGNRRAAIPDERFQLLKTFVPLLERQRGVPTPEGTIERVPGGWRPEEELLLQAGTRRSTGSIVLVGPGLSRDDADEAPMIGVARCALQALIASVATEKGTARSAIRVNGIFPGSDSGTIDHARTTQLALRLVSDHGASVSGMIYHPDERNAITGDGGPLAGQTAVVTGGGRNIGQAISLRLAREGASVVLAGRGQIDLDLTARAIEALGGRASGVPADIAFPGDRKKIIEAARGLRPGTNGSGGVDLWVNNAGIGGAFATLDQIELDGPAQWHQTLAIDFTGAWLGMARAILEMRRRGVPGGIVNISTYYADQPYVFRIPYTVPKILLKTCAALLADPLRPYGLYISDIRPSLIDGPRFQWVAKNYAEHFRRHGIEDPASDPEIQEWFRRQVPERAPGPDDVAEAVFFAARRGLSGSGQEMAVSTLPISHGSAPPAGSDVGGPGRTVVLVSTARTDAEIDRAGALATWSLESGSSRVIVAADDGMMARLVPRLSRRSTASPWWNLTIAPQSDGRLEFHGIDPTSPTAVSEFFETLGEVDSVIHVPGAPDQRERFVMFPTEKGLTDLDEEALERRYRQHQRALSLFLERHVTAALIVARQAARSLAPGGTLAISRGPAPTPEAVLANEAMRQIIRIAAEEFRLLGKNLSAAFSQRAPSLGARLSAYLADTERVATA
jgi:NAD(P)-dependent dehydrogenase (short-subunit alcohol dehydrogenase family)